MHAGLVHILTNKLGVFYVFSKLIADVLVFTVVNMFLLRFIVFPKNRRHHAEPEHAKPEAGPETEPAAEPFKDSQPRRTGPR